MERKAYSRDVSDDAWAFVAPSLTLMTEDAPQRNHPLRDIVNGLRMMPHELPPWEAVYQQTRAGCTPACVRPWCMPGAWCCGWRTC
jgi:transposase